MIRRPPRSTLDRSSAASDVYKRQMIGEAERIDADGKGRVVFEEVDDLIGEQISVVLLSLIHISEPTRPY